MSPTNLTNIFTSLRAKNGDEIAQACVDIKRFEKCDLQLESLSMSLQMQFSRLQRSSLQKLQSRKIGKEIRHIVENGTEDLIKLVLTDEDFFYEQLYGLFTQTKEQMSAVARINAQQLQGLNLIHDFESIAYNLQNFEYADVIRLLKCMLIISIHRRAERRQFFN